MKISLQIILADARSPGRGLPPPPFDRHISGELPNLDNIIQESESQYGDSARADTIQLPRAAGADSARWRVPTQGPGTAPSAQGLGFEVRPLTVGGPAEIPPSGSDSGSQPVPPQPRRPASGRKISLSRLCHLSPRPDPTQVRFPALPARTPQGLGRVSLSQKKAPAWRVPPKLPAGPR